MRLVVRWAWLFALWLKPLAVPSSLSATDETAPTGASESSRRRRERARASLVAMGKRSMAKIEDNSAAFRETGAATLQRRKGSCKDEGGNGRRAVQGQGCRFAANPGDRVQSDAVTPPKMSLDEDAGQTKKCRRVGEFQMQRTEDAVAEFDSDIATTHSTSRLQSIEQDPDTRVQFAVRQIAVLIAGNKGHELLVVTGAGVEDTMEPNAVHALCSLVCAQGGKHITTNFSGVQLLAQPEDSEDGLISGARFFEPRLSAVQFIAIHSTIYDQQPGRRGERRRPRCRDDANQTALQTRGRPVSYRVPIPTQGPDLHVNDPNKQEAEAAASGRTTLLIMGSSLRKSSNGKALSFLEYACDVSRVFYINPDVRFSHDTVTDYLVGWGLPNLHKCPRPKKPQTHFSLTHDPKLETDCSVQCFYVSATKYAELVLAELPSVGMPAHLRDECSSWIAPAKVSRFRALFPLPPVEHLAGICEHTFGQQGLTIKQVYHNVVGLNNTCARS